MSATISRSERKSRTEQIQARVKLILREYAEALAIAIILALVIRVFVVSAYRIPTDTMAPNLVSGDFVFSYKLPFGLTIPFTDKKLGGGLPVRGEVVVFRCPLDIDRRCVKRVIGLPGDRIEVHKERLKVNHQMAQYGRPRDDSATGADSRNVVLTESLFKKSWPIMMDPNGSELREVSALIVPPGHIYVLSDNRDQGADSRTWGFVKLSALESRVALVWLSVDWEGPKWAGILPQIRWARIGRWLN